MKRNRLRERLERGEAVCLANPTPFPSAKLVEMIGLIGFDGVWLDMEHQDYSFDDLFHMALACRATGMDSVARIRKGAYWSYFRNLEAGATGIMVPHCCSAEEAQLAVRNARFHPQGARGMDGVEPHAHYGRISFKEYLAWANREILVSVQIEDREGVEKIDEIVAVPGIDGVMVGPGDLSQSFGLPGVVSSPAVIGAIDRVAEACLRHGKWWGIPVARPELAAAYYDHGARLFVCGAAVVLLNQAYSRIWDEFSSLYRDWKGVRREAGGES